VTATLAAAGLAGPVIFVVVALAQSLLRPEHNLTADPISALAAGPTGWVQDINFMASSRSTPEPGRRRRPRAPVTQRDRARMDGLVPRIDATGAFHEKRLLHIPGFIMTFLGAGTGLIAMSRWMAADPRWQSVASYALAAGIVILLLLLTGAALVRPPGAPLRPWWGLFQWVLLAVWLPCTVVLALSLLRVARAGNVPP
jgi:hypothetical membrane protein